jgi:hypothetical protein
MVPKPKEKFKYGLEQTLSIGMTHATLVAPSDLKDSLKSNPDLANFPLYAIARRPRLKLTGVASEGSSWELELENPVGERVIAHLESFDGNEFDIRSLEGGLYVSVVQNGAVLFRGKPSELCTPPAKASGKGEAEGDEAIAHLDLEVLYVGKSDDEQGVAHQRLNSHSTLQQILADQHDHAPDYEVWVIPMRFGAVNTLTVIHGHETERDLSESIEAFNRGYAPSLAEKSSVALAEAAAIRHFQPFYNVHYKKSFPSRKHVSYDEIWPLDYGALGVVVDTRDSLGCRLWGPGAQAAFHHEELFPVDLFSVRKPLFTVDHVLDLYRSHKSGDGDQSQTQRVH